MLGGAYGCTNQSVSPKSYGTSIRTTEWNADLILLITRSGFNQFECLTTIHDHLSTTPIANLVNPKPVPNCARFFENDLGRGRTTPRRSLTQFLSKVSLVR